MFHATLAQQTVPLPDEVPRVPLGPKQDHGLRPWSMVPDEGGEGAVFPARFEWREEKGNARPPANAYRSEDDRKADRGDPWQERHSAGHSLPIPAKQHAAEE